MIRALFDAITANPDVVGQVRVMREDVEPEKLDAYESKLRRARDYLTERNLKPRPICRTLNTETPTAHSGSASTGSREPVLPFPTIKCEQRS